MLMLPINPIYEGHGHMKSYSKAAEKYDLDVPTRIIHLGLMVFGILAWLLSGWAEEYECARHLAFTVHRGLGKGLAPFIALRLIYDLGAS